MTETATASDTLPRWDLESLFPGPESPEFRLALDGVAQATADLEALFDRHGVGAPTEEPSPRVEPAVVEEVIDRYNAVLDQAMRIEGYLYCLVAADVRDEAAQSAASEWRQVRAELVRINPRFVAWTGSLDLDALAAASLVVRDHIPALRRLQSAARHLMPPGEEDLAAALGPSGPAAWMALRDDVAGRATARIEIDGEECELALSEIDNLLYHPDRALRRRAFAAEQEASRAMAVPLAAALNGIKGHQLTLSRRRGWGNPLDQALFDNAIDRATFDAMQSAIDEALPDYRRYLRAKARLMGVPVLAGYDLRAPVGSPSPWPFDTARTFIEETFATMHPRLGALADRAFAARWIDAAPRPGKDGGAFAMPVGDDQSRVFANFEPVYDGMSTLAHELGHAYHTAAVVARGRTMLQAPAEMAGIPFSFPLTLSETASTICEAVVQRAARRDALPEQEAALLDGWLQALTLNVFATRPMFTFEHAVFAARGQRELAATEIEALMANAWRDLAADAIDPDTVDATRWTTSHFFIDGTWYYSFPYAFGMLFGLGLLAVWDASPDGFFDRLDELLADSGMCEAADLAARFDIDLRDPAFWRSALDLFRADVDRYEALSREA